MEFHLEKIYHQPLKVSSVPFGDHPGTFGARRKHDIHTGIDLYTIEGADVYAMEDGEVIQVAEFTGPNLGMTWWNTTWAVMICGQNGIINYGELKPDCKVGQQIKSGEIIGKVIPVLPSNKLRLDIPGHSCSMLHIERYQFGYRKFAQWNLGHPQPEGLVDPTSFINRVYGF